MNPKHNPKIPKSIEITERRRTKNIQRQAIAPYNFVELPEEVIEIPLESLPQDNCYYLQGENLHTGRIECNLTTESPLYIRCGLTKEEFICGSESKDSPDFFYKNPIEKSTKPVIPGSSLRGMIRNLAEIITFSKIDQVSNQERLFFRAVAVSPERDSLGKAYKNDKKIQAGYLKKDSEGWYIQPAKKEQGATFAWVKEIELDLEELIKFNNINYKPQYIPVSYGTVSIDQNDRAKRLFASDISTLNNSNKKGVLVTSGNMKQGNQPSSRRNHCIVFECLVFESDSTSVKLRLDDKAVEHYCNALTDFQKQEPFNENWGMLNENCSVVFYYPPKNGNKVGFFGQSPNFRIPYSPKGDGHASTVTDFIPSNLKNTSKIDLADAIFGWVKQDKDKVLPENMRQCASRVFITDAQYESNERGIWYKGNPHDTVTPPILSEPKPTCFQHYLVQRKEDNPQADKSKLKHYASQPESETVIRGHKLYWHKGIKPDIEHPEGDKASGNQITKIKPINTRVKFKFNIYFENLSSIELGALLWVIDISQLQDKQDKQYRLKLGMGKPFGMGTVKIEPELYLSDRQKRYRNLFNGNHWETGEPEKPFQDLSKYKDGFERDLLKQLHNNETYQNFQEFTQIPRIQMLLAMLKWEEKPPQKYFDQRRYMEIDRKKHPRINDSNEYKERPVLPTPLQIIRCDDIIIDDHPPSLSNLSNSADTLKLRLKPKNGNLDKPIHKDKQSQKKPESNSEAGYSAATARPPKPKK